MGVISIIFLGCLVLFPGPNAGEKTANHEDIALEEGDTSLAERNERSLLEMLAEENEDQSLDSGTDHNQLRNKRNDNLQIGHLSRKRRGAIVIGMALLEAGGHLSTVLDLKDRIGGFFSPSEVSNNEIHETLLQIDSKIDEISNEIGDLKLAQEYSNLVIQYSDDVKLLKHFAKDLRKVGDDGTYDGSDPVIWAKEVTKSGYGGLKMALENMHDLVMGTSAGGLGSESLFEILYQQMAGSWQMYFDEIPVRMAEVVSLQLAGYSALLVAWKTRIKEDKEGKEEEYSRECSRVKNAFSTRMDKQLQFLEKYLMDDLPVGCPGGFTRHGDVCYKVFKEKKNWDDASTTCSTVTTQGLSPGRLAMAKDLNTNNFLVWLKNGASTKEGFHFGLSQKDNGEKWKWADGSELGSFKDWADGEPSNGRSQCWGWWWGQCTDEDCVEFLNDGNGNKWNDIPCTKGRNYFICEVAASRVACEGKSLQLRCSPGTRIHVISANYGCDHPSSWQDPCKYLSRGKRHRIPPLPPRPRPDTSCSCQAINTYNTVRQKCQDKYRCFVNASNENFGDPCPGTLKYLTAEYKCV